MRYNPQKKDQKSAKIIPKIGKIFYLEHPLRECPKPQFLRQSPNPFEAYDNFESFKVFYFFVFAGLF